MIKRCLSRIAKYTQPEEYASYGHCVDWNKVKGSVIKPHDVVFTLETDKMCIEVRASDCGIDHPVVLKERLVAQHANCPVGDIDLFEYEELTESESLSSDLSLDRLKNITSLDEKAHAFILEGNPHIALDKLKEANRETNTVLLKRSLMMAVAFRQIGAIDEAQGQLDSANKYCLLVHGSYCSSTDRECIKHESANLALIRGDYEGAKLLWFELINNHGDNGLAALYALSTLALEEGNLTQAIIYCKQAFDKKDSTLCSSVLQRRIETLYAQLQELEKVPAQVVIKKSNAPIVTCIPDHTKPYWTNVTTLWQPKVFPAIDRSYTSRPTIEDAAKLIRKANHCVAVTGSGISIASGLKTRQDLWQSQKWDRDECVSVTGQYNNPKTLWNLVESFLKDADPVTLYPQPCMAHFALSEMERNGYIKGIITQNVDGLHQAARSSNVIEMHGSLMNDVVCRVCGFETGMNSAEQLLNNKQKGYCSCLRCQTILRPDVVLFGEIVPKSKYDIAKELIAKSDVLLVVGTACDVAPTSDLVVSYAQTGRPIIEIALSTSLITHRFETMFFETSGETVLPDLAKMVFKKF